MTEGCGVVVDQDIAKRARAHLIRLELFRELLARMYRESIVQYEFSVRLALLFGSVLKVRQAALSVKILAEQMCVEEIITIGRTIVEVVVNAAYLQYAEDIEIDRYLQFDKEFISRQKEFLQLHSGTRPVPSIVQKLKANALRVSMKIMPKDDDPRWSAQSIAQRAEYADKVSESPIMALLVKTLHARGHSASHGTFQSMTPFISALETMVVAETNDRFDELTEALFGVNLSLMTLCLYLNNFLNLALDEAIHHAARASADDRGNHAH